VRSPAPASPVPTLDLGPYATVTPALSLYLMALASSFSGHLGFTPAHIVSAHPLPSAVDGTAHAERIGGWSLKLDTLPLADSVYLTVVIMFYIANCCYFNLCAHTVEEMRAGQDITIVPNMAIPLVAWFAAMWGLRYPKLIDFCPAVMLHHRLVCCLPLVIRGYRVPWRAGREFGMSPRLAAWRAAVWVSYPRDRAVSLERRTQVLVDEFHHALGFVVEELLTPEDRICFQ